MESYLLTVLLLLVSVFFLTLYVKLVLYIKDKKIFDSEDVTLRSPLEEKFWRSYRDGKYRNKMRLTPNLHFKGTGKRGFFGDFVDEQNRIIIEIDGWKWHNTKKSFISDRKRERELESLGYKLIRFAGVEVYNDPDHCVEQTYNFIKKTREFRGPIVNFLISRKGKRSDK